MPITLQRDGLPSVDWAGMLVADSSSWLDDHDLGSSFCLREIMKLQSYDR